MFVFLLGGTEIVPLPLKSAWKDTDYILFTSVKHSKLNGLLNVRK